MASLHATPAPATSLLGKRSHFSVFDDLLLCDERIVIPRSMRLEILNCLHTGQLGITKCRARARASVWWPGLSMQIENPAIPSVLKPNVQDTDQLRVQLREDEYRSKQHIYHAKRHQVLALPSLTTDEQVWVETRTVKVRPWEPQNNQGPT